MKKIIKFCREIITEMLLMFSVTIKTIALVIEEIISLDKNGRSYFNSSRNYKNTSHTYKNDYRHYLR